MYRSNGNYEAFARPKKPAKTDTINNVYLVGAGLASLSAAVFLIRDAQMPGNKIHILEELDVAGGAMDGRLVQNVGYVMRGGREMEDQYECLWDMFRSIPSFEDPEHTSVLDEFYWLNKEDPNYTMCRLTEKQGVRKSDDGQYTLSAKGLQEIVSLVMMQEAELNDKKITDVFTDEFFNSNFWMYWKTMFAFEPWGSALEMRRYLMRFVHHVDGLPDFTALKFTKYDQYYSMIIPLTKYLEQHGVVFEYNTTVTDIDMDIKGDIKTATGIEVEVNGKAKTIPMTKDDLVFVTNGSLTESSTYGSQDKPAPVSHELGGSWSLWKKLAAKDKAFGNPDKFIKDIPEKAWFVSGSATMIDERVYPYIEKITHRAPNTGKTVTGGIVTCVDSSWQMSWTINRQPQIFGQPKNEATAWIYALYSDVPGDYIKKKIVDCTGEEICEEWLYQMGVPVDQIHDLATNSVKTIPVYMPYVTSYFMPRAVGDRPKVIPEGSQNLLFIGNFAEVPRDTLFTTEYSVRTAMEGVYEMLGVDRGVPEVYGSVFDIRYLLRALYYLTDKKEIPDMELSFMQKILVKKGMKMIDGTWIEQVLEASNLLAKPVDDLKTKSKHHKL